MARIRTIKPELFRHEDLYNLEVETNLPLRFAFSGLFTVADREGRFEWKPKVIKLDVLPFDGIDFERVLDALASRGFIIKYTPFDHDENPYIECVGKIYGVIPTFKRHQVINNKESDSKIPAPDKNCEFIQVFYPTVTRDERDDHAMTTPLIPTQGEGKGREEEREGKGKGLTRVHASILEKPTADSADAELGKLAHKVIARYCELWKEKYKTSAYISRKWAGNAKTLVKDHGINRALELVESFMSMNDSWFVQNRHSFDLILTKLSSITHFAGTGVQITNTQIQQLDKTQTNKNAGDAAAAYFRNKEKV